MELRVEGQGAKCEVVEGKVELEEVMRGMSELHGQTGEARQV